MAHARATGQSINDTVGATARLAAGRKPPTEREAGLISRCERDGFVIIPEAFTDRVIDDTIAELSRLSSTVAGPASAGGRNAFEGYKTKRIYALLDKSRAFDVLPLHPDVLALNDHFLSPGWQLNAFHSISIQPGEAPQALHHDDGFVELPRPHKPFGTAIMIALDDYTEKNGATVVIPGSDKWDSQRRPDEAQSVPVVMPKGSVVYFLGTLVHGGGMNVTGAERRAVTVQYCQPWVRPLENQILAVGWDKLREMDPRLVDMLGYKVAAPFVGYVDGRSPLKAVQQRLREMTGVAERAAISKL